MMIVELLLLALLLLCSVFALSLSLSFFFGPPFLKTPNRIIDEMIRIAKIDMKDIVFDLGSGEGSVIVKTAKICKRSVGYEINPFLVLYSKIFAYGSEVSKKTKIYWGNYFNADLEKSSVIMLYNIRSSLPSLEKKFKKELKPNTRIASYKFPLTGFELIKKTKSGIYLYIMDDNSYS